ncbi:MAG: hypothetical protein HY785_25490 [Oscillatoriophycideae cyanobacterium NC_groundwater_1537_Pr4_S-0.65um_50_18]|nr:hypothetical protein [Oscillatoriophycideae cyanobacterium NC_groundwater_1537_Pr4_S-0.65um_50_18]
MKELFFAKDYRFGEAIPALLPQVDRRSIEIYLDLKQKAANFSNSSRDFPQKWRSVPQMLER